MTTEADPSEANLAEAVPAAPAPSDGSRLYRMLRLAALIAAIVALGITQGVSMLIVVGAIIVMIFLHELGHFVMARRAGMLATEFFIGFGPKIFSFKRGETEYGLKAIPAGAYVRIIGMSSMEEVPPELESRTYRQKSYWQRIGVAVAGSTMHFILALLLLMSQFALIGAPDGDRWAVGDITAGSAAQAAGIKTGDEVIKFDDKSITSFDEFRSELKGIEPGQVNLTVVRDGSEKVIPIDLSTRMMVIGTIGEDVDVIDTGHGLMVAGLVPGGAAESSGLMEGSALTAVNGEPVGSLGDVAKAVETSKDGVTRFETSTEAGATSTHSVDLGSAVATTKPTAFVGVGEELILARQSLPKAAWNSLKTFGEVTVVSIKGIGQFIWPPNLVRFVTNTVSGSEAADPTNTPTPAESTPLGAEASRPISIIGVAMLGSDLSSQNMASLVQFLALINIFFGVFNLFPMLPFDGGHVVIAMYERVRELRAGTKQRYMSDVSKMAPFAYAVIGILAVVGLLAMFLDITKGVNL
ncbi:MAG TPA: RIP metalloprotease RseP [Microthrixaceae bacterium]|nr:RIP metalloprotease RseP [Microthrixaceae bacterium]